MESFSSDLSSLNKARFIKKSDLESLNANEESKKNEIVNLLNELNEQSDEQSYRPPTQELRSIEVKPLSKNRKRSKNSNPSEISCIHESPNRNPSLMGSIELSSRNKGSNRQNIHEVEFQIQNIKW